LDPVEAQLGMLARYLSIHQDDIVIWIPPDSEIADFHLDRPGYFFVLDDLDMVHCTVF
jgi:hypothetical protein